MDFVPINGALFFMGHMMTKETLYKAEEVAWGGGGTQSSPKMFSMSQMISVSIASLCACSQNKAICREYLWS